MTDFTIDPTEGHHAGSHLTNEAIEQLVDTVLWELAIRTSERVFRERLSHIVDARRELEAIIAKTRNERDLMRFAADVTNDLDKLPLTTDASDEAGYGLYL